jgi:glutamate racemase
VEQIEAGDLAGLETERILWRALKPMLAAGVDTIILGCTHYPFVLPLIQQLVGPGVSVIDPAPAVARQVKRVLQGRSLLAQTAGAGTLRVYTTGDPTILEKIGNQLLETPLTTTQALWRDDMIELSG